MWVFSLCQDWSTVFLCCVDACDVVCVSVLLLCVCCASELNTTKFENMFKNCVSTRETSLWKCYYAQTSSPPLPCSSKEQIFNEDCNPCGGQTSHTTPLDQSGMSERARAKARNAWAQQGLFKAAWMPIAESGTMSRLNPGLSPGRALAGRITIMMLVMTRIEAEIRPAFACTHTSHTYTI